MAGLGRNVVGWAAVRPPYGRWHIALLCDSFFEPAALPQIGKEFVGWVSRRRYPPSAPNDILRVLVGCCGQRSVHLTILCLIAASGPNDPLVSDLRPTSPLLRQWIVRPAPAVMPEFMVPPQIVDQDEPASVWPALGTSPDVFWSGLGVIEANRHHRSVQPIQRHVSTLQDTGQHRAILCHHPGKIGSGIPPCQCADRWDDLAFDQIQLKRARLGMNGIQVQLSHGPVAVKVIVAADKGLKHSEIGRAHV